MRIHLDAPFHVGGGKGADGVCDYLLRDGDGNPYWPGSAFKGKVRHFGRLLYEGSGKCCSFKHALLESDADTPCDCPVCDMLGGAGNAPGGLLFTDLKPAQSAGGACTEMRTGNAIDRYRRTANDNSLFRIETAGDGSDVLEGVITGTLAEDSLDDQKKLLKAAIKMIPHIGGSTGRGLGWVREGGIEVVITDIKPQGATNPPKPDNVTLPVTITAISPLLVGTQTTQSNFRATLRHIPGSVVRAALAAALIAKDGGGDAEKRKWVTPDGGNGAFPTLRKAFGEIRISQFTPMGCRFAPLTAQRCKYDCTGTKQTFDTLRDDPGECPHCHGRVERAKGFIHEKGGLCAKDPLTMVVTKSAINRYSSTAQDGMLFSMEVLTPPVEFSGTIRGKFDPDELRRLVEDGIRVGGYQTAGYGQCAVHIGEPMQRENETASLRERIKRFGSQVPVTLLSDALVTLKLPGVCSDENLLQAYRDALFAKLPESVALKRVVAQHSQWRGFNTSEKTHFLNPPIHVINAGAVFVLEAAAWTEDAIGALAALQANGVCEGLHGKNGYGQVTVADVYHLNEMGEYDM
ncbi:MAG: RAMP superfamily CRISPR-associated protein, partial [Azoarcus sp.]|nr:RAMP superfamily CRISPR-associated protein [Azoarcus sp.]